MMDRRNNTPGLTDQDGKTLLQIARDSLERFVQTGHRIDLAEYDLSPALTEAHGAFVTLRKAGELRGCIGYTAPRAPLAEAVRDNAINAATRDPRFPPVTVDELPEIRIEVSALQHGDSPDTPFIRLKDVSEIVLGRDGLYLEHAGRRGGGLLLPQVPIEQGWDRDQFLEAICTKAGALPGAWARPGVVLYRFSAQIFVESDDLADAASG
jgi:AmmeMemoRadiSam system protein A